MGVQVKTLYLDDGGDKISTALRPFYSFNWGGKDIEEFNLVATLTDNGLSKTLYSDIDDTTEEYDEINGQTYYRTKMKANSLSFSLATDGMTEREMTNFVNFFRPGKIADLILAEHPNRKISARVSSAPTMEMVPFEAEETIKIASGDYTVTTTEYKGSISLNFTMDYPFWEATSAIIGASEFNDSKKVIYEDGLPYELAIANDGILFANNNTTINNIIKTGKDAVIRTMKAYDENSENPNIKYLYYCGTAPTYPTISFSITVKYDESNGYIKTIGNRYATTPYSYIQIGDNKLKFTLPSLLSSYNETVKILNNYDEGDSFEDLMTDIRENVVDYYMRAAVIGVLNSTFTVDGAKVSFNDDGKIQYKDDENKTMLSKIESLIGSSGLEMNFTIDCKEGATNLTCVFNGNTISENCGDMIVSKYLVIDKTNSYDSNGYISNEGCTKVISSIDLSNLVIDFNYMYL